MPIFGPSENCSHMKRFLPLGALAAFLLLFQSLPFTALAHAPASCLPPYGYWQQRVDYQMEINFDVTKHQFKGTQRLVYTNNSPDELTRVFYHLYFNAFQPGSMMDVRSQNLPDADRRVGSRIAALKPEEQGWQHILSLKQDGKDVLYKVEGTILEVQLQHPIKPGESTTLDMKFEAQVPLQIRRSGRDNSEGIAYSMSQWYPKLCEYDYMGWHVDPYVGREFYGVWGDFDVTIHIAEPYILAATGYLVNPEEIGYGYEKEGQAVKRSNTGVLSWHFKAENVHDFAWAADPDYTHTTYVRKDGLVLHFFYQKTDYNEGAWEALPRIMNRAFDYLNAHCGQYPYKQFSFVQAGDGGMEYPMLTLITGERPLRSLVGVSVHELIHNWYYGMLATNESLYAWMDEGFTSYFSDEVMNFLKAEGMLPGMKPEENPHLSDISTYTAYIQSGAAEPLTTHADHFSTNYAYGVGSYVQGALFLHQLKYIIGEPAFERTMLRYFDEWKFKHPTDQDFIRVAEKESDMELDWYWQYWIASTKPLDYSIASVLPSGKKNTRIELKRQKPMPMPMDVIVHLKKGKTLRYTIPLRMMVGEKTEDPKGTRWEVLPDWPWTHPSYSFEIPVKTKKILSIELGPAGRIADINPDDNLWKKGDDSK